MLALGLAAIGAVATILIFLGLRYALAREGDINARLEQVVARNTSLWRDAGASRESLAAGLDKAVASRSFAANIARDLARANLKITVTEYITIHVVMFVLVALLTILLTGNPVSSVLLGFISMLLPRFYVALSQQRRLNAFNTQLADTCGMLTNALRTGYSLLQAMEMVSREGPSPTSDEFQRVVREVGLGLTPEQALANLVRRMNSEDLDLMVTAINVQHEVGGNLALVLDSIGHTIRERVRVKGEIKTLTSQVSCSGNVVSMLPIGLCILLYLLNSQYIMTIFQPSWVLCLPALAAGGIIAGWTVMRKITEIEV
ncbi:MAG: type II secretion system F family protein [Chloroflexi bacterium]|nr:type II secretion system F family protein [Chloroflexota bacterium]MCL5110937.1 type II secretion system F family protein [Chloroflexota bacterium]